MSKFFCHAFLWMTLAACPAFGQGPFKLPTVEITGDETPYPPGDIAVVGVKVQQPLPEHLIGLTYRWVVIDNGTRRRFFSSGDGSQIAFGTGTGPGPRPIVVMLDVNALYGIKQRATLAGRQDADVYTEVSSLSPDLITAEVSVREEVPSPHPTPPAPSPESAAPRPPDFDAGRFGLAQFTYNTITGYAGLTQAQKVSLASELADSLEGIASQVGSLSTYRNPTVVLKDTKTRNDAIFAKYFMTPEHPIRQAIGDKIFGLYSTDKLTRAEDIADAWREMAAGLRAVK